MNAAYLKKMMKKEIRREKVGDKKKEIGKKIM